MTETKTRKPKARSVEAWASKKRHDVTLPSGFEVSIEIPNLARMIKGGELPNPLVEAALSFQEKDVGPDASFDEKKKAIEDSWDYVCFIVPIVVTDPELTSEDVDSNKLPYEDVEMLAGFANRSTDTDAIGHQIGGLEANAEFRKFRHLDVLDTLAQNLS